MTARYRWTLKAACLPAGERFLELSEASQLATCARCPVRLECLEAAIALKATESVWGGIAIGALPIKRRRG